MNFSISPIGGYNQFSSAGASAISGSAMTGSVMPGSVGKNEETNALPGARKPEGECETCKNRKYKDGSDEMVSFKSPAHISPEASSGAVRSHEQEHVSNAYAKASKGNGQVLNASVTLKTAVCPECGRSYVAGGTTRTQIKYYNEENPYQKDLKAQDSAKYSGMNLNLNA